MSLTLSNVKDTKNIEYFFVEHITEILYSYEDGNPLKYSEDGKMKDLQQTLNSINDFLLSLVISYVG